MCPAQAVRAEGPFEVGSTQSPTFTRFMQVQNDATLAIGALERVRRIDAIARSMIDDAAHAERLHADPGFADRYEAAWRAYGGHLDGRRDRRCQRWNLHLRR